LLHSELPKPPTSLLVTAVTAHSISLRWNAAPSDLEDPVVSYVVQYRSKTLAADQSDSREFQPPLVAARFREIRDVTDTEYDVSGLEAFTLYQLRVISVNGVGRSQPSYPVDATTSQLGILNILNGGTSDGDDPAVRGGADPEAKRDT